MKVTIKPGSFLTAVVRRFGIALLFCVFLAVVCILDAALIYEDSDAYRATQDLYNHLSMIAFSGLCWSTAACCLKERFRWRWFLIPLFALAGTLIAVIMPDHGTLVGGLGAAMVFLSFHGVCGSDSRAERLGQVCSSFFIALGISLVLMLALELTSSAFFSLFFADTPSRVVSNVSSSILFLCLLLFAPLIFFGLLPRADEEVSAKAGFRKFCGVVLLPLYLILEAVLLFYVLKILVSWTMPVGVMNGYALASLTMFTGLHLVLTGGESKLSGIFVKWGGWLMLPILIAQQVGVWMRLSAYGLTTSRVLGILVTVLCAAVVITSLLRRRANWFFIAAAAMCAVFIASPLNAENLARYDQEHRLIYALGRNAMLTEDSRIIPNEKVNAEDVAVIYSAVDYLNQGTAPAGSFSASLQEQTAQLADELDSYRNSDAVKIALLGFPRTTEGTVRSIVFNGTAVSSQVDTAGYDFAQWISCYEYAPNEAEQEKADRSSVNGEVERPLVYSQTDVNAVVESVRVLWNGERDDEIQAEPILLSIYGETVSLSPLLVRDNLDANGAFENRYDTSPTYKLINDEVTLPSGKVFRIASLRIVDYTPGYRYNTDYISVNGWLLTPEAE